MKRIIKVLTLIAITSFSISSTYAQIVVRVRPTRPRAVVVRRPAPPSAHHVWVKEEWVPRGNTYIYKAGYWAAPPRSGAFYVDGHWRHTRGGWIWVPGHWR